jgi:hypothetical protein
LICSREEYTHTENIKRKKENPTPITKKYIAINVSWIWVEVKVLAGFPEAVYHVYVCMHACWYFKSKPTD